MELIKGLENDKSGDITKKKETKNSFASYEFDSRIYINKIRSA